MISFFFKKKSFIAHNLEGIQWCKGIFSPVKEEQVRKKTQGKSYLILFGIRWSSRLSRLHYDMLWVLVCPLTWPSSRYWQEERRWSSVVGGERVEEGNLLLETLLLCPISPPAFLLSSQGDGSAHAVAFERGILATSRIHLGEHEGDGGRPLSPTLSPPVLPPHRSPAGRPPVLDWKASFASFSQNQGAVEGRGPPPQPIWRDLSFPPHPNAWNSGM